MTWRESLEFVSSAIRMPNLFRCVVVPRTHGKSTGSPPRVRTARRRPGPTGSRAGIRSDSRVIRTDTFFAGLVGCVLGGAEGNAAYLPGSVLRPRFLARRWRLGG